MAYLGPPNEGLVSATVLFFCLCGSVVADTGASTTRARDATEPDETPAHWRVTGSARDSYTLRSDRAAVLSGRSSAALFASKDADPSKFGALMQSSSSVRFRGKRVEFSAYIAVENAPAGASIWLRADDANGGVVAFENTFLRGVRGTEGWTYQVIVMDIPLTASTLHYGAVLNGRGTVYADDLHFRIVDASVPITGKPIVREPQFATQASAAMQSPAEPRNLDFEDVPLPH